MNLKTATDYALPIGTHATAAWAAFNAGANAAGVSATPLQAAGAIGLPAILSALLALWQWWRKRKQPAATAGIATYADIRDAFAKRAAETRARQAEINAEVQEAADTRALIVGKEPQP